MTGPDPIATSPAASALHTVLLLTPPQWFAAGAAALVAGAWLTRRAVARARLSLAKHPSLRGHPRSALRLARLLPYYACEGDALYDSDGAPPEVAQRRRAGFRRLGQSLTARAPRTIAATRELEGLVSDVSFTASYRVPFQYREAVRGAFPPASIAAATRGVEVQDLDGNWSYDVAGSYGVNLCGHEFYKRSIEAAVERARGLGPVLGAYHPVVTDVVRRLRAVSGLDEVSFHMSGTEAVMQAVRLARYHTRRAKVVRFCGAYHGWWDGVQPGPGNPLPARDVYTLRELDERTLRVLRTRRDIACVLVNPLQALHPNASAPTDSMLVTGARSARLDRQAYRTWLAELRAVCDARGIALILDEVFLGFRLARGGAQEYFGVRADLVTYGKTLGGGLPVGVLCGRRGWMKRFRDDRPSDVCFARGTFNAHPYVLAAMDEFLRHLDQPESRAAYATLDAVWDARAESLNRRLADEGLPVRFANLTSVWTTLYTQAGRYHWMFQHYLRAEGLSLPWTGSGRLIFSHDYRDEDFEAVAARVLAAARAMHADGWWWRDAQLTSRSIQRRVLGELVRAAWRGRARPADSAPAGPAVSAPAGPDAALHPAADR